MYYFCPAIWYFSSPPTVPTEGVKATPLTNKIKQILNSKTTISISMKKFTLLLCLCFVALSASQRVYADGITESSLGTGISITISTSSAGQVNTLLSTHLSGKSDAEKTAWKNTVKKIIFNGTFNESDLQQFQDDNYQPIEVNMAGAHFEYTVPGWDHHYHLYEGSFQGSPSTGLKIAENASLYQKVQKVNWVEDSSNPSAATIYPYSSDVATVMENARLSSSLWSYAAFTTGFMYCQMNIAEGWSEPSLQYISPTSGHSVYTIDEYYKTNGWSDIDLSSKLSGYSNGDVIKVQRYYQKISGHWTPCTTLPNDLYVLTTTYAMNSAYTIYANPSGGDLSNLNHSWGSNGDFLWWWVYYKKVNDSWSDASLDELVPESGRQLYNIDEYYKTGGWCDKDLSSKIGDYQNGDVIKVQRYYKKINGEYTLCTNETLPNDLYVAESSSYAVKSGYIVYENPGGGDLNHLDDSQGGEGHYMWWWVYYKKDNTRSWTGDTNVEQSGASLASFDYNSRNEHTTGYEHGDWVKMPSYQYYQLREVSGESEWKPISFSDGDVYEVTEFYNSLPDANSASTINNNQYVVVCTNGSSDKKVYNGTTWVSDNGSDITVTGYGAMKFGYWQSSVETVTLPAGITAAECSRNIFSGCSKVTTVTSGETTANIYRNGTTYATISGSDAEFARLRDILLLDSYVADVRKTRNVLDLRSESVESITTAYLNGLTDSPTAYEYILLPAGVDKDIIFSANYDDLESLRAVISSNVSTDSEHKLAAYVKVAGSLAEARCLATGHNASNSLYPTPQSLTSVALAGNLNLNDISEKSENNALYYGTESTQTITELDLKRAVFVNEAGEVDCSQMNFLSAGFANGTPVLSKVELPTDDDMDTLPEQCFMNIKSLHEICIPYNYQYIRNEALYDSGIEHITTTDKNGALIDNGPNTYTLSANLKELGNKPDPEYLNGEPNSVANPVFPKEEGVKEIYSLAVLVPKCYKGVFAYDLTFGYGGPDQQTVYSREKYFNNGDQKKSFVVLRFPSKESYNQVAAAEAGQPKTKEDTYEIMEKYYTDPTKIYSKKDQTGAVDANGDPLLWPTRTESNRIWNQANNQLIWDDWETAFTGDREINDGGTKQANAKDYPFIDYIGWHQIVLTQATYVEPDETVEDNKIIRNYIQGRWYTFCIPYDMTYAQVRDILGIPASDAKYTNKLGNVEQTEDVLPDIRTLKAVKRTPGSTNQVLFTLSKNLSNGEYWQINDANPSSSNYVSCGNNADGEKIVIKGGYPYLVRPYFYLQGTETADTKSVSNLGRYVMTRFGDKFDESASCVHNLQTQEDCGGGVNLEGESGETTMLFAKPFEHHKIQAFFDNGSGQYATHSDGKKYYYTFIGQFWKQPLPLYSFYMYEGNWYHFTSGKSGYYWNAYKCIIMATQEVDDHGLHPTSGFYRDNNNSVYPTVQTGTRDFITTSLKLQFLNGLDDTVFGSTGAREYRFELDDDIMEFGEDGEPTVISNLDGEDILPVSDNNRIYNMAGQYVGTSLEGLSKGMYIVKGKKFVVK